MDLEDNWVRDSEEGPSKISVPAGALRVTGFGSLCSCPSSRKMQII